MTPTGLPPRSTTTLPPQSSLATIRRASSLPPPPTATPLDARSRADSRSPRENLALNPEAAHVTFEVADLTLSALPAADIVTANLTGALLVRSAERLAAAVRTEGVLIVSGLLAHERGDVVAALSGMALIW